MFLITIHIFYLTLTIFSTCALVIEQPPFVYAIDGFSKSFKKNFPNSSKLKAPRPKVNMNVFEESVKE